jgi:chloramphenicol O-acetyltransferase type B
MKKNTLLEGAFTEQKLSQYISQGYPITIGRYTYGGPQLYWDKGDFEHCLDIGSFCSIADDVGIFVGSHGRHHMDYISSFPMGMIFGEAEKKNPSCYEPSRIERGGLSVRIGNDVWIGRGATIMPGVTIGDGAVVATRAVVAKNVSPYQIVGGVPAKLIRSRFSPELITKLLEIKWWDWDDELIEKNLSIFFDTNLSNVLRNFGSQ